MPRKMIIRSKTFRQWLITNLGTSRNESYLPDIARYGCSGGFPGLTWYSDTRALYDKFEDELWQTLYDYAIGCGEYKTVIDFLAAHYTIDTPTELTNSIVWAVAELYAQQIVDNEDLD